MSVPESVYSMNYDIITTPALYALGPSQAISNKLRGETTMDLTCGLRASPNSL